MELRHLRYLVAVADEGSITAAADVCSIAQPSLSQAIKTLERELDIRLLERVGRGVLLTAAGEAVVEAARDTLRAAESVHAAVAGIAGLSSGRLDLVALPTLAVDPVGSLIGEFRVRYPGVTVRLRQADGTADLLDGIRSGRSEIGVTEAPRAMSGLTWKHLTEQELVVVLPPSLSSMPGRTISREKLADLPVVTSPAGTSTRRLLDEALASVGRVPNVVVETNQRDAIVSLVVAGAGAAILPSGFAATVVLQGAAVRRVKPPIRRSVGIVRRDGPQSPAAKAFAELAAERFVAHATRGN